ncbi:hypothetical protein ABIC42_007288 [Variovorax sp. 1133]
MHCESKSAVYTNRRFELRKVFFKIHRVPASGGILPVTWMLQASTFI